MYMLLCYTCVGARKAFTTVTVVSHFRMWIFIAFGDELQKTVHSDSLMDNFYRFSSLLKISDSSIVLCFLSFPSSYCLHGSFHWIFLKDIKFSFLLCCCLQSRNKSFDLFSCCITISIIYVSRDTYKLIFKVYVPYCLLHLLI